VPKAGSIGLLVKPGRPSTDEQISDAREAARTLGLRIHLLEANREGDFERAFATLVQMQIGALLVGSDPFFNSRRDHIVALAARHHIPAIYETREFAMAGGLMSYGTILTEGYREIGIYTGKILKGARPADLPVQLATKVELIVNLKTAKTLGITVPQSVQNRADEVIE